VQSLRFARRHFARAKFGGLFEETLFTPEPMSCPSVVATHCWEVNVLLLLSLTEQAAGLYCAATGLVLPNAEVVAAFRAVILSAALPAIWKNPCT